MTPEELERSLEFLVRQQAAFDARLDKLAAAQERTAGNLTVVIEALGSTIKRLGQLTEHVDQVAQRVDQLAQRVDAIGEKLDAFIVIVERYITRNGGGTKPS